MKTSSNALAEEGVNYKETKSEGACRKGLNLFTLSTHSI